jgi:flagellar basal body-associated protein FliL
MLFVGRCRRESESPVVLTLRDLAAAAHRRNLTMAGTSLKTRCIFVVRFLGLAVTLLMHGCYDGNALVRQAQSTAINSSMAEVDLGEYRTTLPRDNQSGVFTSIEVHIFGTVPRSRLSEVKKQLRSDEFRVRHETLAAVRQSSRDELSEPTLAKLRARIEDVVNRVLADAPLKEIGFYQLTVR